MSTSDPGRGPDHRDQYGQDPHAQGGYEQGGQGQGGYSQGAEVRGGYGQDPYGQGGYGRQPAGPAPRNGLGVAALVVGIVSVLLGVVPLLGFVGLVAVVLGVVGLSRVRRGLATNRGMSITGIVLGGLAVLAALAWLVLIALVFNSDTGRTAYDTLQRCSQVPQAQQQQCVQDGLEGLQQG